MVVRNGYLPERTITTGVACIIHEDSQRCGKRPLPSLKGEECAMKEKKSSKWLESQLKLSPNQAFKLL